MRAVKSLSLRSASVLKRNSCCRGFSSKVEVVFSEACKPVAPYSAAIKANGMIYTSGQLGLVPGSSPASLISEDVAEQTSQALSNLDQVLSDGGSNKNRIVKVTVLLADINDFAAVNRVYSDYFSDAEQLPAWTAYQAGSLPLSAKVEIEAVAVCD